MRLTALLTLLAVAAQAEPLKTTADRIAPLTALVESGTNFPAFTFANDGRQGIWTDALGMGYLSAYTRDAAMIVRSSPQSFTSNQLYSFIAHIKAYPAWNGLAGESWDVTGAEMSATYGTNIFPHKDNVYELIDLCYQHYRGCGYPSAFTNVVGFITNSFSWIQLSNHVPWSSTNISGFGFQEYAYTQGYNLMLGVYRYRAMKQMGDMYAAAGNASTAAVYYAEMPLIQDGLRALWDDSRGLFRGGSATSTNHNVIGTAYAIVTGACPPDLVVKASKALRNGLPGGSDYPAKAAVRFGAAGNFPVDEGTNPQWWPEFTGWLAYAVSITDPWAADALIQSLRDLYMAWDKPSSFSYNGQILSQTPLELVDSSQYVTNMNSTIQYGASCLPVQYERKELFYDAALQPVQVLRASTVGITSFK